MAVLVTAASKHGATVEIANVIARKLNEHGVSAELVAIEDVSELDCGLPRRGGCSFSSTTPLITH